MKQTRPFISTLPWLASGLSMLVLGGCMAARSEAPVTRAADAPEAAEYAPMEDVADEAMAEPVVATKAEAGSVASVSKERSRRVKRRPRRAPPAPSAQMAPPKTSVARGPAQNVAGGLAQSVVRTGKKDMSMAESAPGGDFEGRQDAEVNDETWTEQDRFSTFAVDVDTAAYSIARRTLRSNRMPTSSLVRVEEMVNYFKYDYDPPSQNGELFSVQADGALSPVRGGKHVFRVGIQAKSVDEQTRLPANIVFLVDTSCSMTSADKLDLAKRSMKLAVERLDSRDRVAITTYAGGVRLVLEPTAGNDKSRINRAIENLRSAGGTAMASGMELAYQQAARMLGDDRVTRIVVFSDGDANIGATSPTEILRRIDGYVKEGVFLSTIGFGHGNYKDAMMEQLANRGNGNYFYVDSMRQAERVFGRDLFKMMQDVAQDVKIQVEFDPDAVKSYRLVGYENRNVADKDFRNDRVDAGEIGAGHQVTALYELTLNPGAQGRLATVRVRAKKPKGMKAKEMGFEVPVKIVARSFERAPSDLRFATAVMGASELFRHSRYADGWSFSRILSLVSDLQPFEDPDKAEFYNLMTIAARLSGEATPVGMR